MSDSEDQNSPRLHPEKIGTYRIVRLIGEGGMGRVYEGIHEQIGQRAAIKVLHAQYAHNGEAYTRFLNEARAVNIVQHPGVVNIFGFGQTEDGSPYIIMEYLEGESLSARLERLKFISLGSMRIARQIASALMAAHAKHIVHRDLKPSNIMLVPDPDVPGGERVKVVDFGIAKMSAEHQTGQMRTRAGAILGTPLYMSPEQCRGAGEVTEKSDIYSLGVMLYEMLSGRPPFIADGEGEVMGMHLFKAPPPLHSLVPTLPLELVSLVHSMLEKAPEARPSIVEVAHALDRLGQRLSDQEHAAATVPVDHDAAPLPSGPKTMPLGEPEKAAASSQSSPGTAAPTTPTLTGSLSSSTPAPSAPPPAPSAPDAREPALLAAEKASAAESAIPAQSPVKQTAELLRPPPEKKRWAWLAVPASALLVAGAVAGGMGLLRQRAHQPVAAGSTAASQQMPAPAPEAPRTKPVAPEPAPPEPAATVETPAPEPVKPEPPSVSPPAPGAAPQPPAPAAATEAPAGDAASAAAPASPVRTGKRTDNVVELAQEYMRSGQWLSAMNLTKTWGDTSANPILMRRIYGVAACHLRQLGPAQEAYEKLKGEDRKAVALACRVANVTLPEETLRDAESLLGQRRWAEAMAAAQSPQLPRPLTPRSMYIIGIAACQLKDFRRAKEASEALSGKEKAALEATCRKTRPEKPVIF